MNMSSCLLGVVFIISIFLLSGVNGESSIFNVVEFILGLWTNLYERLGGTWRCLLLVLPEELGGKKNPCYNKTTQ
uniref:Secreted protein n=1 Tax=Schistosoma mansoni TaxID=6183 RepID=A0A5K4F7E5_SCHMA